MRQQLSGFVIAAILLLTIPGPLIGVAVHRRASSSETVQVLSRFDEYLTAKVFAIEQEVVTCIEMLYGLRAFYAASEAVSREEFSTFAAGLVARQGAAQALEWIPRVRHGDRAAHEIMARKASLENYRITERGDGAALVPSAPRSEYFPIYFVEPRSGNEMVVGFDVSSETTRRRAIEIALETEKPTMTAPVSLVQESTAKAYLVLLPAAHAAAAPGARVTTAIDGLFLLVLRVDDIIQRATADDRSRDHHLELFDVDGDGEETLVFSSHNNEAIADRSEDAIFEHLIEVAGRTWRLRGYPTAAYLATHRSQQPLWLGAGAFLLWETMVALLLGIADLFRTSARRKQDRSLRAVLQSLVDGVVVADDTGKIVLANDETRRVLGSEELPVPGGDWSRTYGLYAADGVTHCPVEQLPMARAVQGEPTRGVEIFVRNPQLPQGAWFSVNGGPPLVEDNHTRGGVVSFHDITERKRSQQLVEQLSSAVEQTYDIVFITDVHGRIEYVNPAFESRTGYSRAEALGKTPRILRSGGQELAYYENLWETILAGRVFQETAINRKKDGEDFYAEQTITPMRDSNGKVTHFVSVMRDMTEIRKQQEREVEMRLAAKVQQRLYPQQPPDIPGLEVAGSVLSAEETCGDYFDYHRMNDDLLGVAIGDVCGHGLGPALVMSEVCALLRSLGHGNSDPRAILTVANRSLVIDPEILLFVTLLFTIIDVKRRELVYANAGHPSGYVLDQDGRVKHEMMSNGIPLGVIDETEYLCAGRVPLQTGDMIVLLTDGITDAEGSDGKFFGPERALEIARAHRTEPAATIVAHINEAVLAHFDPTNDGDDRTIVIVKVL